MPKVCSCYYIHFCFHSFMHQVIYILSALFCGTEFYSVQDPIWADSGDFNPLYPIRFTKCTGQMSNSILNPNEFLQSHCFHLLFPLGKAWSLLRTLPAESFNALQFNT